MTPNQQLHTAEHLFARSLQNQGIEISVRKVDTEREDGIGEAFIKGIIPLEKLLIAEQAANKAIESSLEVSSENLEDINKAIEKFPNLRFNKEMLEQVRGIPFSAGI